MRILLGYSKKEYTNKDGVLVSGFELYFAKSIEEQDGRGYRPALRFNRKSNKFENWFISSKTFDSLKGLPSLVGKAVNVYTDPDFGNLASITQA